MGSTKFVIPDYANMETINRISTNNGTWTVDRNGFVLCTWHSTNTANAGVFINNIWVNGGFVGGSSSVGTKSVHAVKIGDVVRLTIEGTIAVWGLSCYFIPPVINIQPLPEQADYIVDFATNLKGTNLVNGWYRKWKSDWVEQGGILLNQAANTNPQTVNLFVPMKMVYANLIGNNVAYTSSQANLTILELNQTTYFTYTKNDGQAAGNIIWEAKGIATV
jgi:hypothetical protein